jgi:hypothetical protein
MSKITDYIRVTSGVKDTTYKVSENGLFFISGNSTIKPIGNCTVLYIVVGGGANGNDGTGSVVGRGGGGGEVQIGRVNLTKDVEYTIAVNLTDSNGNGGSAVFEENTSGAKTVKIIANGGTKAGVRGTAGSSTGGLEPTSSTNGDSPPPSDDKKGYGGIASNIGTNGALPGTPTNINGQNGGAGGGGGGGYGSAGIGGKGGPGMVILLNVNNTNLVQHVEKQLREMNHLPGTLIDQYNERYNATMMAGALWTVLATSLAFYVFTQV